MRKEQRFATRLFLQTFEPGSGRIGSGCLL